MAARVLLGENSSGQYGLFVSRKDDNILSPSNPLIFDSTRSYWQGQVYAGGQASSTTSVTWSATKGAVNIASTNVIPLIVAVDTSRGPYKVLGAVTNGLDGTDTRFVSQASTFQSTTTTIAGSLFAAKNPSTSVVAEPMGGTRTSTDLRFLVLKIPCAYGFMSNTYMRPGTS
jgi:hypothetical protein